MDRSLLGLSTVEASYIWRFFNCVSNAVAHRMQSGSTPGEENLTFLLCELLDENYTSSHVLDYSLAEVKADLLSAGTGMSIDVSIDTHEHTRNYESQFSYADLGLILIRNHPIFGRSTRALILQAKKLFPVSGAGGQFTLGSEYRSFKREQIDGLLNLGKEYESSDSIYYLWYNPQLSQFANDDMKVLAAHELSLATFGESLARLGAVRLFWPQLKWQTALHSRSHGVEQTSPQSSERYIYSRWVESQPALRISSLRNVESLVELKCPPKLQYIYEMMGRVEFNTDCVFAPFADFLLITLFDDSIGSSDETWIELAKGNRERAKARSGGRRFGAGQVDYTGMPKHTITVTIGSTLPLLG